MCEKVTVSRFICYIVTLPDVVVTCWCFSISFFFFFFNDTATTDIYPLSLHDALPIFCTNSQDNENPVTLPPRHIIFMSSSSTPRSEEHTSELKSRQYLVCRFLLD